MNSILSSSITEMEPLRTTQRIFMWMCVCPTAVGLSKTEKYAHYLFAFVIIGLNIGSLCGQSAFFFEFITTDLIGAFLGLMGSIANLGTLHSMISAYRMRHKTARIFKNLSKIYSQSKYPEGLEFQIHAKFNLFYSF